MPSVALSADWHWCIGVPFTTSAAFCGQSAPGLRVVLQCLTPSVLMGRMACLGSGAVRQGRVPAGRLDPQGAAVQGRRQGCSQCVRPAARGGGQAGCFGHT